MKLIKQPTKDTCVHACLAMALGLSVDEIIAQKGSEPLGTPDVTAVLNQQGVRYMELLHGALLAGSWHFVAVPSLNIRGGMHQVLVRTSSDGGVVQVLDPSQLETYNPDGSDLVSWAETVWFECEAE